MKTIEKEQLKKLLQIIQPSPMQRIGHFSGGGDLFCEQLSDFCQINEYEYLLNCTDNDFYDSCIQRYETKEWVKIKNFNLARPNYLLHGKFYEYLFVTTTISEETRETFLQKSHKCIKNAGHIILLVPKKDYMQIDIWTQLLEENYFVATNTIDIFQNYEIIISKKMHGWGG